ncbi:MAG TPA: TetR/AcrR family transcriptional regulator [Acidimicrobiia bacterium]|nr:TetR/AcrR family transcriptional regulator [Acidimicrobiia bacterium]
MRADARRNRDRLVDAAVELILEVGAEPPLDAIARRADVGIGTLYRHFPDRERLLDAVADHVLEASVEAAQTALTGGRDGYDALRQYMHAAVRRGVGVLNLIRPLLDDPNWTEQRTRIGTLVETMLNQAKEDGLLRQETRSPDIVFAIIRFSRPVVLGLSHSDERALAHRHLDIYIDGLGTADPTQHPLPEPPVLERWTG